MSIRIPKSPATFLTTNTGRSLTDEELIQKIQTILDKFFRYVYEDEPGEPITKRDLIIANYSYELIDAMGDPVTLCNYIMQKCTIERADCVYLGLIRLFEGSSKCKQYGTIVMSKLFDGSQYHPGYVHCDTRNCLTIEIHKNYKTNKKNHLLRIPWNEFIMIGIIAPNEFLIYGKDNQTINCRFLNAYQLLLTLYGIHNFYRNECPLELKACEHTFSFERINFKNYDDLFDRKCEDLIILEYIQKKYGQQYEQNIDSWMIDLLNTNEYSIFSFSVIWNIYKDIRINNKSITLDNNNNLIYDGVCLYCENNFIHNVQISLDNRAYIGLSFSKNDQHYMNPSIISYNDVDSFFITSECSFIIVLKQTPKMSPEIRFQNINIMLSLLMNIEDIVKSVPQRSLIARANELIVSTTPVLNHSFVPVNQGNEEFYRNACDRFYRTYCYHPFNIWLEQFKIFYDQIPLDYFYVIIEYFSKKSIFMDIGSYRINVRNDACDLVFDHGSIRFHRDDRVVLTIPYVLLKKIQIINKNTIRLYKKDFKRYVHIVPVQFGSTEEMLNALIQFYKISQRNPHHSYRIVYMGPEYEQYI